MLKSAISQTIIHHLLSRYILHRYGSRLFSSIRIVLAVCLVINWLGMETALSQTSEGYEDIIGCLRGGLVSHTVRPDEEYRLFSLRPDGSLVMSLIYESGPRSRVWEYLSIYPTGTEE